MFFRADKTGRIDMVSLMQWGGMFEFDLPDGYGEHQFSDYVIREGILVYDPVPVDPYPEPSQGEQIEMLTEAVADLSEVVSGNTMDNADMADAIAELSELVSQLMEGA